MTDVTALIAEAALAPSVHNVQPARWRIDGTRIELYEDMARRLTVGDPHGNDAGISLGAAVEGLSLAAGRQGLRLGEAALPSALGDGLRPVAAFVLETGGVPDPLADLVEARRSYRGSLAKVSHGDLAAARSLGNDDIAIVAGEDALEQIAKSADRSSYGFMRQTNYRRELVSWMRLSRDHSRWALDGLNADAMAMSGIEALGARLVLGRAFSVLDRVGLAKALVSEGAKIHDATALAVFHRPIDEVPLASGRHFYRAWLRIEAVGLVANVYAALADNPDAAAALKETAAIPRDRRVVSTFRIGRAVEPAQSSQRARLPLATLLITA